MCKQDNIMVSVIVCTYNQEHWIRQTLDSILAQETDYTYEIIIGEDYGTDGTQAICREYVERVNSEKVKDNQGGVQSVRLMPSERNVGVVANWVNCIQHSQGKYIMGCAGDDYWHNPRMLQMMVDHMEEHSECVLCHTDYNELKQQTGEIVEAYNQASGINPPQGMIQKEILSGRGRIAAVTQCIRRDTLMAHIPFDKFVELHFPREDWPMQLIISAYGEIHYIPVSTATYRIGQESITRTSNYETIFKRAQQDKVMTEYLYSLFPEWGPFKDGPYFDNIGYHNALYAAYRNNDYAAARRFAKEDKCICFAKYMSFTKLSFCIFRKVKILRHSKR